MVFQAKPQVGPRTAGAASYQISSVTGFDGDGVECAGVCNLVAELLQAAYEYGGVGGHALCDALQALRAMVDRIHARNHGRQHLGCTDVGGGFFAPDVLLTRLQRQAVGRVAVHIDAHADQAAAGQGALELVAAGQVSRMRSAVAHGHAETLCAAQHDVGIPFAGRREQGKCQQVGGHAQGRTIDMCLPCQRAQVVDAAGSRRVLRQDAEVVALGHELRHRNSRGTDLDFNAQRPGTGLDHLDRLRMAVARNDEDIAFALYAAPGQGHGFGGGCGFVEHGCVGNRHSCQVADHGLEVDQRLHAALRNLGLVWRVGGVQAGFSRMLRRITPGV